MKRRRLSCTIFFLSICLFSIIIVHSEAKLEHKKENIEDSKIEKNKDVKDLVTIVVDAANEHTDHTSIQQAINDAIEGSTIYVKPGKYSEILNIDKSVNLIGENNQLTFIEVESNKNGYAIKISAPKVVFQGFNIINQGEGLYTTGIKIVDSNTTIDDCIIHDTPIGIAVWSSENKISNCSFYNCEDEGIALLGSPNLECISNSIINCEFYGNCDGIELQYSSNNIISRCDFNKNTHAGIDAIGSFNDRNIITNCSFSNNGVFGIYFSRSIDICIYLCILNEDQIMFNNVESSVIDSSEFNKLYIVDSQVELKDCEKVKITEVKNINSECNMDKSLSLKDKLQENIKEKFNSNLFSLLNIIKTKILNLRVSIFNK